MMALIYMLPLTCFLCCNPPEPQLPPSRHQKPPTGRLIRYGEIKLYLLRNDLPPSKWTLIMGSSQSPEKQACAQKHWRDGSWVILSENTEADIQDYISAVLQTPPPPVEYASCPL